MAIEVGPLVRRLRERYRMTQQELVEYTGLDRSASYISSIETGRTSPTLAEMEAIARVFRTTLIQMIEEASEGGRGSATGPSDLVHGRRGDEADGGEPARNLDALVAGLSEAGQTLAMELLEILAERDRRR
jgi:transcriptional regulator with XRE-family HTH domain